MDEDGRGREQQSPWLCVMARQEIKSAIWTVVIRTAHAFHLLYLE